MKIIFDTNMLIYVVKYKIDINQLRGHKLFVLQPTLYELERIGKGRIAEHAKVAHQIAKRFNVIKTKRKNVDLLLLEYGKKDYVIATQDKALQNKLREAGVKYIYLRQKKYFMERGRKC